MSACVYVCVRAFECVRVRACVRARVRACVRACVSVSQSVLHQTVDEAVINLSVNQLFCQSMDHIDHQTVNESVRP